MLAELKKDITSYQPHTGPFFCSIVLFATAVALLIALAHALWNLPSIRCIGIIEGEYSFNGKLEFGSSTVHYEFEYNIPAGSLERISIQGPLKRGIAAGDPDFAITLCGGDQPCSVVETTTCDREKLGVNCARLASTAKQLDQTTPDVGTKIHRTLTAINEHTNRYVVVVEANGERFPEPLGPICQKSIRLPSV